MDMMVTLGVDAHKKSHTIVATDPAGARLGQYSTPATPAGHLRALQWATERYGQRRWAIENCRHVSRRFEADLLTAGEVVVLVPPKMMANQRQGARTHGKSDPIDALTIARAALREPELPHARLEGPERDIRLLVDYRDTLITERTRLQNRLRWRLHELAPGYDPPAGSLDRTKVLNQIDELLTHHHSVVAQLARNEVTHIRELTSQAKTIEHQLTALVTQVAPSLLTIPGCGILTAAKLIGEAADITRFRSRNAYAMWNGTAPIPVWSANPTRVRLHRGGNRQTNAALHRIAITQLRIHPDAKRFITRRRTQGNTTTEALRALKRHLSDVTYRTLTHDATNQQPKAA